MSSVQPLHVNDICDLSKWDITERVCKESEVAIGCGARGDVFEGSLDRDTPHKLRVVIKSFRCIPSEFPIINRRIQREVATWHSLDHVHVARFIGIYRVESTSSVERPSGLVSHFFPHTSSAYLIKNPGEKLKVIREVAEGLKYLHDKQVVHGDIKPNNVMMTAEGVTQIIDFGISQIVDVKGFTTAFHCNARYSAPELIPIALEEEGTETVIRPTFMSDAFNFGMTMLELMNTPPASGYGSMPYNHIPFFTYDLGLPKLVHEGARPLRERYNPTSDDHWNLLCECWSPLPANRPSVGDILERL